MKKNLLLLFMSIFPSLLMAQVDFSGQIRPRTEFRHGYKSLVGDDSKAAFFTSQRTRLNLKFTDTKFKVGISVQDVRTWGDVKQLNTSDKNKLSIHQAWGEILFSSNLSLKLGRQELVYDDSRILGNVGWAQQARSHDLALLKFQTSNKANLHLGLAFNQDKENLQGTEYNTKGNYKNMQFAWYNKKVDKINYSFLFMNTGFQYLDATDSDENETRYTQIYGGIVNYKPSKIGFTASLYSQKGKDLSDKSINAYMFNIGAKMSLSSNWKANVGIEILSGTDYDESKDNNSFTPLFGTNHKFNGHMDYFYVGNHVNNVGLQDIYAGLTYSKEKLTFKSALHIFSANAEIAKNEDKYLGTEIDMALIYKYSKSVNFSLGYSQMFASKSMELIKLGDKSEIQNWGWLMLTFTPQFSK